ncbi:cytochrome b6-f complex subunit PetL [Candidatus Synechococcus calcipolaris]|nr:cytochrome b6-f complex subunit PetL [Candidatus Synechococcus calcipolaris]
MAVLAYFIWVAAVMGVAVGLFYGLRSAKLI